VLFIVLECLILVSVPDLESPDAYYHVSKVLDQAKRLSRGELLYYELAWPLVRDNKASIIDRVKRVEATGSFQFNGQTLLYRGSGWVLAGAPLRAMQVVVALVIALLGIHGYRRTHIGRVPAPTLIRLYFLVPQVGFLLTTVSSDFFMYVLSVFVGIDLLRRQRLWSWALFGVFGFYFLDRSWIYVVGFCLWFEGWKLAKMHLRFSDGATFMAQVAVAAFLVWWIRRGGLGIILPGLEQMRLNADAHSRGFDLVRGLAVMGVTVYKAFGVYSFLPGALELVVVGLLLAYVLVLRRVIGPDPFTWQAISYVAFFCILLAVFSNQAQGKYFLAFVPMVLGLVLSRVSPRVAPAIMATILTLSSLDGSLQLLAVQGVLS